MSRTQDVKPLQPKAEVSEPQGFWRTQLNGWRSGLRTRLSRWRTSAPSISMTHLTFASGLIFTGVVATQVIAPWKQGAGNDPSRRLEAGLWLVQGSVRQAISSLDSGQRLLQPVAAIANAAEPVPSASDGQPQSAATPDQTLPPPQVARAPQPPVDISASIDTHLEMRVAIARNTPRLNVGVSSDGYLMDTDGQNFCNLPAQSGSVAVANSQGIDFNGCQLSGAVWLESAEGGYVYIDDSWYKGRVLLLNQNGTLLAVNFVLLHDYLSSVVGSEMYVHWPLEALKAQAVAARSYALTHHVRHANRPYDLDNTQRYQVYRGIAKETNTTQQAVATTSGEFISYNGGIVESLYAASEQIVQTVHRGQGMSQTGAMEMASLGHSYAQILAAYYPNTGLSRLLVE